MNWTKLTARNKHSIYVLWEMWERWEMCSCVNDGCCVKVFFSSGIRGVGQRNSMRNREEDSQYGNIIDDLRLLWECHLFDEICFYENMCISNRQLNW